MKGKLYEVLKKIHPFLLGLSQLQAVDIFSTKAE